MIGRRFLSLAVLGLATAALGLFSFPASAASPKPTLSDSLHFQLAALQDPIGVAWSFHAVNCTLTSSDEPKAALNCDPLGTFSPASLPTTTDTYSGSQSLCCEEGVGEPTATVTTFNFTLSLTKHNTYQVSGSGTEWPGPLPNQGVGTPCVVTGLVKITVDQFGDLILTGNESVYDSSGG